MRLQTVSLVACSLLVAAGCAQDREYARYDHVSTYPAYSSGSTVYSGSGQAGAQSQTYSSAATQPGSQTGVLVTEVRQALVRDTELAPVASNLQISSEGGTITVQGTVNSEEQKEQIENVVMQTAGVTRVNNQIQVSSETSVGSAAGISGSTSGASSQSQSAQSQSQSGSGGSQGGVSSSGSLSATSNTNETRSVQSGSATASGELQSGQSSASGVFSATSDTNNTSGAQGSEQLQPTSRTNQWSSQSQSGPSGLSNTNEAQTAEGQMLEPTGSSSTNAYQGSSATGTSSSTNAYQGLSATGSSSSTNAAQGLSQTGTSAEGGINVMVQGNSASDQTLSRQLTQALRADTTIAGALSGVHVSIEDGNVTLTGSVRSEQQKESIESAVQRVAGVSSVENQLQVGSGTQSVPMNQ